MVALQAALPSLDGDVAVAVRFLLHNTFTTGAVLKVDGGERFTP
jgi:hypothetical protein